MWDISRELSKRRADCLLQLCTQTKESGWSISVSVSVLWQCLSCSDAKRLLLLDAAGRKKEPLKGAAQSQRNSLMMDCNENWTLGWLQQKSKLNQLSLFSPRVLKPLTKPLQAKPETFLSHHFNKSITERTCLEITKYCWSKCISSLEIKLTSNFSERYGSLFKSKTP